MDAESQIKKIITENPIVLFMKGTPTFPQCGFSSLVVEILKRMQVDNYLAINVLEDPTIRQGIKDYTSWPTIPQLYVHGEFVGGCDILKDLYQNQQLEAVLNPQKSNGASSATADEAS